jgi:rhodanese-related sulfurtransferase
MQQYITFIQNHWELCLAFVVILVLYLALELRAKLSGLAQVSPQQATLLMNHEDAVILDIRDAGQFSAGHILGAINIPAAEIEKNIEQLTKYQSKPIIIVHSPTQPPHKTGVILQENGFVNVSNLSGGIAAWQTAGLPLVKS